MYLRLVEGRHIVLSLIDVGFFASLEPKIENTSGWGGGGAISTIEHRKSDGTGKTFPDKVTERFGIPL